MKKVMMICNAHLDPVWLWRWQEGAAEALSTFRTAAEFCEEQEGFVFCHNEALLYEWVEEYEPELFKRIQLLAIGGKWRIMGGWYLQPDCVMLSGESFIRQIMYGRDYFWKKFGSVPTTAVNFDSFGHSVGLVQILKKAGYDSYIVCRAGRAENLPANDFEWIGLDQSSIVVHYSDENYNTVKGKAAEELDSWIRKHDREDMGLFLWGIGDHGGGPSRQDIFRLREYAEKHQDFVMQPAYPEEYFREKKFLDLPQYHASLGPVSEGCYTSQIRIKQKHRCLENELYLIEKMLSQAAVNGLCRYPDKELAEISKVLMRSQFHDALPGSAIKEVEEDTLDQLGCGLELASRMKARAFFALCSGQKRVKEGTTPVLIYNPHPFAIDTVVDCELVLPQQNWEQNYMVPEVFSNGNKLPSQVEKEASSFEIDWRKRCVFRAHLEPASMNRFDCRFYRRNQKPPVVSVPLHGMICFDNGRLQARLDCRTGLLESLCVDGIPYLKKNALRPVVMHDWYNSWGVGYQGFGDIEGVFELMQPEEAAAYSGLVLKDTPSVRIIEEGEVRTVTESIFRYGRSSLRMRLSFPKEGTQLEIAIQVLWQEKDKMLKLSIPTCLEEGRYFGQTAFGREELYCDNTEAVSHKWSAVVTESNAVASINEGLYGSDYQNGEMRLTLLRSPGYAMSDCNGKIAGKPGIMIDRMDQGERSFRLWLDFGSRKEVMDGIDNRALWRNEVPVVLSCCPPGTGQILQPVITVDAANVVLSAMKKAEYQQGFVLRLYESEGRKSRTLVTLPFCKIREEVEFEPFEVKTLLMDIKEKKLKEIPVLEKEFFL